MGAPLPAKCDKCGKTAYIADNLIEAGLGARVKVGAFGVSAPCTCGGTLRVVKGSFAISNNVAQLTDGPAESWEVIKALVQVVQDSVAVGEAPEKTIERAAEFLPWLSGWKGRAAVYVCNILIGWAGSKALDRAFDSQPANPPAITVQQLKDAVHEALEEAKRQGLLIEPPPPAPAAVPRPSTQRHPMLVKFPITAQKLADYEKESSKVNQFPRGLA